MIKLIRAFAADRNPATATRLVAYMDRYPMAVCLATDDEARTIDEARAMVSR